MTESVQVEGRGLGRRKPKNAPALKLASFLTGAVPEHPVAADHFANVGDWGLYTNDRYGVCGPTSVANTRKLVTRYLGAAEQSPTLEDVYDLYRRSGNPNFDPETGADDNGVILQTMLEALLKDGIGGVKPLAFAQVDHTKLDEVRAAIAIFGSVIFGVDLETAQQSQTDNGGPWDYKKSGEWGGHAVMSGRYSDPAGTVQDRTGNITWAEPIDATDAFLAHQLDEAWVIVWPEHLGSKAFIEGADAATLAREYESLTGRTFRPDPNPQPTPEHPGPFPAPADVADQALAAAARAWLRHRHVGADESMAKELIAWIAAKNL